MLPSKLHREMHWLFGTPEELEAMSIDIHIVLMYIVQRPQCHTVPATVNGSGWNSIHSIGGLFTTSSRKVLMFLGSSPWVPVSCRLRLVLVQEPDHRDVQKPSHDPCETCWKNVTVSTLKFSQVSRFFSILFHCSAKYACTSASVSASFRCQKKRNRARHLEPTLGSQNLGFHNQKNVNKKHRW